MWSARVGEPLKAKETEMVWSREEKRGRQHLEKSNGPQSGWKETTWKTEKDLEGDHRRRHAGL